MLRKFAKLILANQRVSSYLKSLYVEARTGVQAETSIGEAFPINCRESAFDLPRFNLFVPALSIQHVFGGISTALDFFDALTEGQTNVRLILTDQSAFSLDDNPAFADWVISSLDDDDGKGRRIIPAGDRYGKTLVVGKHDRFVGTAWWTALSIKSIQQWQCRLYKSNRVIDFIYLIQDFEPGFYPWSSRYALAESTYHDNENVIAVFNSSFLKSFFDTESYDFPHAYVFEPSLHPKLRQELIQAKNTSREHKVLIYGRPSVDRNAFQIIVMAIKQWVEKNPQSDWEFISAGETFSPIELGSGKLLSSLGKLSLLDYTRVLSNASVGISLMISPHPSYPPLEMAAFGIRTITNRYKGKDLSVLTSQIISIDSVSPVSLEKILDRCINEIRTEKKLKSNDSTSQKWNNYLYPSEGFEKIVDSIHANYLSDLS